MNAPGIRAHLARSAIGPRRTVVPAVDCSERQNRLGSDAACLPRAIRAADSLSVPMDAMGLRCYPTGGGGGVTLGTPTKLSLPPLANPCTWIPILM